MALSLKEFTTLKKLMALTTSTNDCEALVALRKANAVLAAHQLTWEQVFSRIVKVDGPAIEDVSQTDAPRSSSMEREIEAALQTLVDTTKEGSFRDWVLDMAAKWEKDHYLTQGQREAVLRCANNPKPRR